MLQKNPMKRPSVWDLVKIPYVNDRINRFVEEHGGKEEVAGVLDLDPTKAKKSMMDKTNSIVNSIY